ncbi:MAG: hypothetical protein E7616_06980 [Ruminococcaceae bacterium]|nr:hypothetical protein [Oscillospiraceae bacterium]
MKKKIFAMGMAFIMLLLCACGGEIAPENNAQTPTVEDPASPEKQPSPTVNEEEPFDYSKVVFQIKELDVRRPNNGEDFASAFTALTDNTREILLHKYKEGETEPYETLHLDIKEENTSFKIEDLMEIAREKDVASLIAERIPLFTNYEPTYFEYVFIRPAVTEKDEGHVVVEDLQTLNTYRTKYENALQNSTVSPQNIADAGELFDLAQQEGFFDENALVLIDLTGIDIENIAAVDTLIDDNKTPTDVLHIIAGLHDYELSPTENAGGTLIIIAMDQASMTDGYGIDLKTEVLFETVQMPQSNA